MINIDSQRLGYKLNRLDLNYSRKLQANLTHSQGSFSEIQTPGWSSMIKSELSERHKILHNDYYDQQKENTEKEKILRKLRNQDILNWGSQKQCKIKVGIHNAGDSRSNILKNKQISKQKQSKQKRFHQISVHQHLYMQNNKYKNKRMLEKVVDEQIKKRQIFSFRPSINKKSNKIAEIRFSRAKQNIQFQRQVKSLKNKEDNQETKQESQKQSKQAQKFRLLNQTFYLLSQGESFLEEKSLEKTIEQFPVPCLMTLQPILEKIYKGNKIQWVQFLQFFNSKSLKNKESFYPIMKIWFKRKKNSSQTIQL